MPRAHRHPVNKRMHEEAPLSERAAEKMAAVIGSWKFLIIQTVLVSIWIFLNVYAIENQWDPYPFVLLNLCFSVQAAYTGPILLIAANRSAQRDRLLMEHEVGEIDMQKSLLGENTALTQKVHDLQVQQYELVTQVHKWMSEHK